MTRPLSIAGTDTTAAGDGGKLVIKLLVGFDDPNCPAEVVDCTVQVLAEIPKEKKDK